MAGRAFITMMKRIGSILKIKTAALDFSGRR
jgi:hypothetical protein